MEYGDNEQLSKGGAWKQETLEKQRSEGVANGRRLRGKITEVTCDPLYDESPVYTVSHFLGGQDRNNDRSVKSTQRHCKKPLKDLLTLQREHKAAE